MSLLRSFGAWVSTGDGKKGIDCRKAAKRPQLRRYTRAATSVQPLKRAGMQPHVRIMLLLLNYLMKEHLDRGLL